MTVRALLMIAATAAELSAQDAGPVTLVDFRPATGTFAAGDTVKSAITFRFEASTFPSVWIGYSVRDPGGTWHDAPPIRVGSGAQRTVAGALSWAVPPTASPGQYRVVMAVWTARPGEAGAVRLLSVQRDSAFRVRPNPSLLSTQPGLPWTAASHALGRGAMRADMVFSDGDSYRLTLGARSCNGAEMRSASRVGFGEYSASMRVPNAPGSLSALFLYKDGPGDNDEIDIEIFNDDSRRALLTAWIGGVKTREAELRLPFDPRAGFHEYTIDWTRDVLIFRIDGKRVARWTRDFPVRPMRLVFNAWWPVWLTCAPLPTDASLEIRSIRLAPRGR